MELILLSLLFSKIHFLCRCLNHHPLFFLSFSLPWGSRERLELCVCVCVCGWITEFPLAAGPGSVSAHRPPLLKRVPVLLCPCASLTLVKHEPVNLRAFPKPPIRMSVLRGNKLPLSAVQLFYPMTEGLDKSVVSLRHSNWSRRSVVVVVGKGEGLSPIQCHWELLIKAPPLNGLKHWSQAVRGSHPCPQHFTLDLTQWKETFLLLYIMYGVMDDSACLGKTSEEFFVITF